MSATSAPTAHSLIRIFAARTKWAVLLVIPVLIAILSGPVGITILAAVAAGLGAGEFFRAVYPPPLPYPRALLRSWYCVQFGIGAVAACMPVYAGIIGPGYLMMAAILLMGSLCFWLAMMRQAGGFHGFTNVPVHARYALTACLMAWMTVGVPLGCFVPIALAHHGRRWLIIAVLLNVASDVMSLISGQVWKWYRKKLGLLSPLRPPFPKASPGKTWAGYIGGFTATIAIGALVAGLSENLVYLGLSAAIAISAPAGDLYGSTFKRCLDLDDWSSMLGPHGGLNDRLDSLNLTAPAALFVLMMAGTL